MPGLYQEFKKSVRKFASEDAVWFFDGEVQSRWSYRDLLNKVDAFAEGLVALGLKPGDRLALIASNGPYWPVINFAAAREGIVLVPIHTTLSEFQIHSLLEQSRVKAVFVGHGIDRMLSTPERIFPSNVSTVICDDPVLPKVSVSEGRQYISSSDLLINGETRIRKDESRIPPQVQDSDISTIMYTSGTTGEMKGVLLTHGNLIHNAVEGEHSVGGKPGHVLLSVLPLSHAFERVAGLLGPLFIGCIIAYGKGLHHLADDIKRIRPHHVNVVPRLLEKMYEGIHQAIKKKSPFLEKLFFSTVAGSKKYQELCKKKSVKASLYFFHHQLGELLFYKKIRQQLGGRLDRFISGGAALDPKVGYFFASAGFKVLEGYGLTECSPIVTVSPFGREKIGSVGLPLPGVEVRIGPEMEIWVRGPNVMQGYENNPKATSEVIDPAGWFHTGDQGFLDEQGFLYIRGRIKELIVTSYGKNIIPSVVERALETSPLIHQAVIFGHGKPFPVGLVVLNPEEAKKLAEHLGLERLSWNELCQNREVNAAVEEEIRRCSQSLALYERLKKFIIIPEEFSEELHFLTPTLKLKRNKISEKYAREIGSMYGISESKEAVS